MYSTKIKYRRNGNDVKFESRRNGSRRNGSRQNGSRRNGSRQNGNTPSSNPENTENNVKMFKNRMRIINIAIRRLRLNRTFYVSLDIPECMIISDLLCSGAGRGSSIGSVSAWHASGPEFDPYVRHILSWRLGPEKKMCGHSPSSADSRKAVVSYCCSGTDWLC